MFWACECVLNVVRMPHKVSYVTTYNFVTCRSFLETITFVSGYNSSIQHPLIYKHPNRHDDTILVALGVLSGQYIQTNPDGTNSVLSKAETQFVQGNWFVSAFKTMAWIIYTFFTITTISQRHLYNADILEAKILGSNMIHTHHWENGDLLVLNNPSLAHVAGPGSQGSFETTGLRLMHRSTVAGKVRPSKQTINAAVPLAYKCHSYAPFEDTEYCLFSLKVIFHLPIFYVMNRKYF